MILATNVTKKFGKLIALNSINVSCNKGESIALIGPNGSGKTTFIKCLLGMVVPDSGFITFNKQNIKHDWKYRSRIGYMAQTSRFPENMTIAQVIDMMKDIRKPFTKQTDDELVKQFELDKIMEKRMRTLSGRHAPKGGRLSCLYVSARGFNS
ncbi:MAG: ATP-binding cassette domain-containing protein [Segetibacter sp.]